MSSFGDEAEEVLSWEGIGLRLAENSPSWPKLVRALQEASVEAAEAIRKRNRGDSIPTPENPSSARRSASQAPLLSAAREDWAREKSRTSWSLKVREDYLAWTSMFLEIAGDRPISDYTKADARAFKDVLLKLPANWQKKRETRGLGVQAAAARAADLHLEPMSLSNVNKGLRRVAAFWHWAEVHHDGIPVGLFKGLPVKDTTSAREQLDPVSTENLQELFSSPLFHSCRSERRCSEPGEVVMNHTARFWLPILGLLTGARLNELCQLLTSDVREEEGVAYLHLTTEGEGQRLKTSNAKRGVPLHQQLVDLGFLEFVADRRAEKGDRLFREMRQNRFEYFSDDYSKFFSRYLERIGAKTKKTSFHSFLRIPRYPTAHSSDIRPAVPRTSDRSAVSA